MKKIIFPQLTKKREREREIWKVKSKWVLLGCSVVVLSANLAYNGNSLFLGTVLEGPRDLVRCGFG